MSLKNSLLLILAIFASFNFASVKGDSIQNENEDSFYTKTHKNFLARIPLIKPYELLSSDEGFTWNIASPFNSKHED